jgi:hypothetical protein
MGKHTNSAARLRVLGALVLLTVVAGGSALADPPAASGTVIRFDDVFWYCHVDPDAGLWAYYGISDVESYCATGSPDYVEPSDVQWVLDASSPNVILEMSQGDDLTTGVYELIPGYGCSCDAPNLGSPLATGTVDLIYTDNALFGPVGTARTNTWGYRTHGSLATATGSAQYSSNWRATLGDPQGVAVFITRIRLEGQ